MKIAKQIADKIIENIRDIIEQDLNFMDKNGMIISSTDPNREGSYHEAAVECIKNNNCVFVEYDDQYKGAKKGINVPVYFDNRIVGVIGITGSRKEVEKYGTILQKMTEILLQEDWIKKNKIQRKESTKYFLEGIIYNNPEYRDFGDLDKNIPKYIVIGQNKEEHISIEFTDVIHNILDKYLKNYECIYSVFYKEIVILFTLDQRSKMNELLTFIQKEIKATCHILINFGISRKYFDLNISSLEYNNSIIALRWANSISQNASITHFDDMDLGILLPTIDSERREIYRKKILSRISEKDYSLYHNLMMVYAKNNGSITKISQELFLHKNTIQYRLNRLHSLTGYNPRDIKDFVVLYLAFLL